MVFCKTKKKESIKLLVIFFYFIFLLGFVRVLGANACLERGNFHPQSLYTK